MNDVEIKACWVYMGEAWSTYRMPDESVEGVRVQVWRDALGDIPIDVVRAALAALTREHFEPTVGQIRDKALALIGGADGTRRPDFDEAWVEVMGVASRVGYTAGIGHEWSHPAIANMVRSIGWRRICFDDNHPTLRSQSKVAYEAASDRLDAEQTMPPVSREIVTSLAERLESKRRELDA